MVQIYGIKNCDTMKKAFKWLDDSQVNYQFNDYKKGVLNEELVRQWIEQLGWEALVNKRGITWRKLEDTLKNNMSNESAVDILQNFPSLIKRPLLINEGNITLGFKAEEYQQLFSETTG